MAAADTSHLVEKNASLLTAKVSTTVLNGGARAAHGLNPEGFLARGLGYGAAMGNVLLYGLVAAASAAITQMEYRHKVKKIIDLYQDELSSKLGKSAHHLVEKDLDILAKGDAGRGIEGNKSVSSELFKLRAQRTLGVALSIASSLAAVALVGALIHLPVLAPVVTALEGSMFGIPALLAEGVLGVAFYNAIKTPLKMIGHKIFGLDYDTTHDRIADLVKAQEKGKTLSREQVLEVFAGAHPAMDRVVVEKFGKHFHELGVQEQHKAMATVSEMLPIDRLTIDINEGKYKLTELLFAAEGQASGASSISLSVTERASQKSIVQEWSNHPADRKPPGFSHVKTLQAQAEQTPTLVQQR